VHAIRDATVRTEPLPCYDEHCYDQNASAERIAMAIDLCNDRGVRLTEMRHKILELLWEYGRPTGAYELIEATTRRMSRPIKPPTVYRALDFLMSQGLVTKIESRNAYIPCTHPEYPHECLFYICIECDSAVELEDPRLEHLISQNTALLGFSPIRRMVEIEGICIHCTATDSA